MTEKIKALGVVNFIGRPWPDCPCPCYIFHPDPDPESDFGPFWDSGNSGFVSGSTKKRNRKICIAALSEMVKKTFDIGSFEHWNGNFGVGLINLRAK